MKKQIAVLLCCSLATPVPTALASNPVSMNPRIEVGYQDYELETKAQIFGTKAKDKYQINPAIIRLGLTAAWNRVYLDGYYQTTNNDSDTVDFAEFNYSEIIDGDRSEYTASLGYTVFDPFAIFLGYRHAKAKGSGTLGADYDFKSDAFFVGSTYSWQVSDTGVLSFNIAYADVYDADQNLDSSLVTVDLSGDGNGLKTGVSWRGALSDKLSFSLAADWYKYDYDLDSTTNTSQSADVEETEITYRIGLVYAF